MLLIEIAHFGRRRPLSETTAKPGRFGRGEVILVDTQKHQDQLAGRLVVDLQPDGLDVLTRQGGPKDLLAFCFAEDDGRHLHLTFLLSFRPFKKSLGNDVRRDIMGAARNNEQTAIQTEPSDWVWYFYQLLQLMVDFVGLQILFWSMYHSYDLSIQRTGRKAVPQN